jgi:signal transduction histidine kinase
LTKALTEANHARFRIKSAPGAGTLVEIAFPANRTVAD